MNIHAEIISQKRLNNIFKIFKNLSEKYHTCYYDESNLKKNFCNFTDDILTTYYYAYNTNFIYQSDELLATMLFRIYFAYTNHSNKEINNNSNFDYTVYEKARKKACADFYRKNCLSSKLSTKATKMTDDDCLKNFFQTYKSQFKKIHVNNVCLAKHHISSEKDLKYLKKQLEDINLNYAQNIFDLQKNFINNQLIVSCTYLLPVKDYIFFAQEIIFDVIKKIIIDLDCINNKSKIAELNNKISQLYQFLNFNMHLKVISNNSIKLSSTDPCHFENTYNDKFQAYVNCLLTNNDSNKNISHGLLNTPENWVVLCNKLFDSKLTYDTLITERCVREQLSNELKLNELKSEKCAHLSYTLINLYLKNEEESFVHFFKKNSNIKDSRTIKKHLLNIRTFINNNLILQNLSANINLIDSFTYFEAMALYEIIFCKTKSKAADPTLVKGSSAKTVLTSIANKINNQLEAINDNEYIFLNLVFERAVFRAYQKLDAYPIYVELTNNITNILLLAYRYDYYDTYKYIHIRFDELLDIIYNTLDVP